MNSDPATTLAESRPDGLFVHAVELVEREAWLDLFAAAPAPYAMGSSMMTQRLGSAAGLANRSIPIVEMNRVMCLGLQEVVDEDRLDEAIAWLDDHAAANWAIQMPDWVRSALPDDWLDLRCLSQTGNGWAKFRLMTSDIQPRSIATRFEIRLAGPELSEEFGATVQAGFGLPANAASWFSALPGRTGWRTYLAFDGFRPIAAAAMFVQAGWAWMGIDATLDMARNKGAQTALISRRLQDGCELGVIGFTAETANPPPIYDTDFRSFDNYCRAGFVRTYVRQNYNRVTVGA